jgi:hypothetical protein
MRSPPQERPCLAMETKSQSEVSASNVVSASAFLDRFQVRYNRCHVDDGEAKLRHVRMAGHDALRQSLLKRFDWMPFAERAKWWCLRMSAGARAADSMAACAVPCNQEFTPLHRCSPFRSFSCRDKRDLESDLKANLEA